MPTRKKAGDRARPTLGLVMGDIDNSCNSPIWSGVCEAAEELDVNLICFTTGATDLRETMGTTFDPVLDLIDTLSHGKLDGLILVPSSRTFIGAHPQVLRALCDRSASLPKICIGASPVAMPTVHTDTANAVRKLLEHLVEVHGRRRIALVSGDPFLHMEHAYREALAAHDLPVDEALIVKDCESPAAVRSCIAQMIHSRIDIDAVVLPDDARARGAVEALLAAGISVPEQVAVVSCNDQPDSCERQYAPTTIRLPLHGLGRRATELMLARIRTGVEPADTVIPAELVIRHSCGCAESEISDRPLEAPPLPNVAIAENPDMLWHRTASFLSNLLAGSPQSRAAAVELLSACGIHRFYAGYWGPPADANSRVFRLLMDSEANADQRCWNPVDRDPAELFTRHVFSGETRYTMLAMHSFFTEPNGVLILEKSVVAGYIYERLRMAFNAAIRMLLTIEQLDKQAGQLEIANAQLAAETEERKRAADSFTQEHNLLNTLMGNMPDSVYVKDMDGRFMLVNPPLAGVPNMSAEDVIGKTDYDFLPKELADAYRAAEEDLFRTGKPIINFEQSPDSMRGISGWRLITKVPFRDINGRIAGLVGINRDITEIRSAELALKHKDEELRQTRKMDAIGRLAGGIAHDFNNILTVIFGYSEAATIKARAGQSNAGEINAIMQAAEKAKEFTDHLLAFSTKQFLALTAVDLNTIVDAMSGMLAGMIGEDIELDIQLATEAFSIRGDEAQLEQVIVHLAVNAREAMPDGGKLSILTEILEITESDPLVGSGLEPGPCVLLSVIDTGSGMDEPTLGQVFEPFFTTKDRGKGTGVGLSTSYGIVKQCGGHIGVKSVEGAGTTFQIYFPILPVANMAAAKDPGRKAGRTGPATILVAEDNEAVLRVVAWALEREGYIVTKTRTGAEALAVYRQDPDGIDLVITDVVMPHMGGVELMDHVRELRPDAKLLCISGYLDRKEIEMAVARSGIPALQKPFAPETLVDRVRETLAS